ncbi:fluoroquinolone transporter permease [Allonocardiopsis opalescens]|uniref:Fluoroquinolone transport system permease protein n=1 Tax=Allonocardiopsis opalescens TaxID=1144618 RepID=A0A2T0Q2G0_9ACTN|nr:fluoroquinolone transporter permease [Allonocardiopsis opalescens]PRX97981.1 fluoroquinolone transport system permease protein [Allonocardiopsis opalescens]
MSALRHAAAFGRNDLAGVRRDTMLRFLVVAPFVYVAVVRFPLPALTELLRERYAFDLLPYHPLIISLFLILGSAAILGALAGLMLLEEKDAGTLLALRVTPVALGTFAAYRAATVVAVTAGYVVVGMLLCGLVPAEVLPGAAAAALCAGLLAAALALTMALVANNQVEGLAVVRALGIVVAGLPAVPYFVPAPWELLFGVLPSYWPVKVYWVAAEGGDWWPYAAVGTAYLALVVGLLLRAYAGRRFS